MRVDIPYDETMEPIELIDHVHGRGVWAKVSGLGEIHYDHLNDEACFMDGSTKDEDLEDVLRSVMMLYIEAGLCQRPVERLKLASKSSSMSHAHQPVPCSAHAKSPRVKRQRRRVREAPGG